MSSEVVRPEAGSLAVMVESPALEDAISISAMPPLVVTTPSAGDRMPRVVLTLIVELSGTGLPSLSQLIVSFSGPPMSTSEPLAGEENAKSSLEI